MKYLFKCRDASSDVFESLCVHMLSSGFDCTRIIDEEMDIQTWPDYFNNFKHDDITLITSDHVDLRYKNGFSVVDIIEYLKPQKLFYGLHDLGVTNPNENELSHIRGNKFVVLSPGIDWERSYPLCNNIIVGHPKFNKIPTQEIKYKSIFFVSCVYLYIGENKRSLEEFCSSTRMQNLLNLNIPFKFPRFYGSVELINSLSKYNINIIDDNNESSFECLVKCGVSIAYLG